MKKISFAIGDTVRLIKPYNGYKKGTTATIEDCSIDTGELNYMFNGCAWFPHQVFEFISEATLETLRAAIKKNQDEYEE